MVPTPDKVLKRTGNTLLTNNFWVVANVSDSTSGAIASYFVEQLNAMDGASAYITDLYSTRKHDQSIKIEIIETTANELEEDYSLDLTSPNVQISGSTKRGLVHGVHTFLQLLDSGVQSNDNYALKKMIIKDQPSYGHRGVLLTNVISEKDLPSLVNTMARLKLNLLVVSEAQSIPDEVLVLSEFYSLRIVANSTKKISSSQYLIDSGQLDSLSRTTSTLLESDTCLVRFSSNDLAVLESRLKLVSELGWAGKKQ